MRNSKAFEVLQKIGKSFFLPISILPFAGILLGVGASFINPSNVSSLGLESIIYDGSIMQIILKILFSVGLVAFANLPLLFAIAVAIGLAKRERAVAALAATVSYLVMNATINQLLLYSGKILADGSVDPTLPLGSITTVLGTQTLQTGVFGGIVVGIVVSILHNKYYKIELPSYLSFFGGTKFIPIISIVFGAIVGIFFYIFWPFIQFGISQLGNLVINSGYFGTFLFGVIERALIPFGLHHAFYIPIWTTGLGGSMEVAGKMVYGAQSIYFAQLADPNTTQFSIDAVRFLVGKYPFMMGGLPGAALAMYHCVPKEKREKVKGLYFGAGLTTFLTGITEPIEFTFLFLSPLLFVIHVICAGISFVACHALSIAVGTTFSDGLIDFTIFGLLQGASKTRWPMLVVLMVIYFVVYYIMFKYLIIKWDIKIPGRDDNQDAKLYTKADYINKNNNECVVSSLIVEGLGGKSNILDVDNCATRLRITLKDINLLNDDIVTSTGSTGILKRGNAIQIIYGPRVSIIKSNLVEYLEANEEFTTEISEIYVPISGKLKNIEKCSDEGFAQKMMGDGYVIEPTDNVVCSPVSGIITNIFPTKHAISIETVACEEILIHIGIDTIKLNGEGFNLLCKQGDRVKAGQKLIEFDIEKIKKEGYGTEVIVVYPSLEGAKVVVSEGEVKTGEKNKVVIK